MSDENQDGPQEADRGGPEGPPAAGRDPEAPPSPAASSAPPREPHPAFEYLESGGPTPPEAPPWAGEIAAEPPQGFYPWLAILAVLGFGALLVHQLETALLIGIAGLYVTAQGADAHPGWRWIHALVAWVPPVSGLLVLAALAGVLFRSDFPPSTRLAVTVLSGLSAAFCLLSLVRPVADALVRLLFRGGTPSHTLRLTAHLALFAFLLALPTWFALRGELSTVLDEPESLVSATGLASSLIGYVVLALASVGWLVRRSLGETLARLGLTPVRAPEWLVIAAGVVALWLFNSGSEVLQRSAFPALWSADQRFTEALAHALGPGLMVLLGLSAGIGEEITMRGALQPRFGVVLTSLLFAALHVQYSWYGIASIFVFGLILGVIRQRSSTSAAILVHALYDVLALVAAR